MKKLFFIFFFFFNVTILCAQESVTTPISKLMEFGATGIFALILMGYIYKMQKDHYKERDEWRKDNNIQFNKLVEVTESIVTVVSDLKGTLEAMHREMAAKVSNLKDRN